MRSLRQQLLLCLLALAAITPSAHAQSADGALLVHCQSRVTSMAARFERARRVTLNQCARKSLRCPDVLTSGATAGTDACLGDVATKCGAHIAAVALGDARLLGALTQCTQPVDGNPGVSVDEVTGDDGLAYDHLTALCPQSDLTPDQLSQCQVHVLTCNADLAFATAIPRGAELLARLGLPLDDSACIGNTPCGNDTLDAGEECDDGSDNSDTVPDACRTNCLDAHCGDGVVDSAEECDDGNATNGDGCESDCTLTPGATCGDGTLDAGEECDDGPANSNTTPDGCRINCRDAYCGDGVVDSAEECDDGNTIDGDGCDSDCTVTVGSFCGDGVIDAGEACDDGADNSDTTPDACRSDCTAPRCGDGVVDPINDESCEPPGTILCTSDCQLRAPGLMTAQATVRAAAPDVAPPAGDLVHCQTALLTGTRSLYERTVGLEERCTAKVLQCTFGISADSDPDGTKADTCFAHANDLCLKVSGKRDALLAKQVTKAAKKCKTGKPATAIPLASLVDNTSGLGFQAAAEACPAADGATVDDATLFTCVYRATACAAEGTVARSMPSAVDLLGQLDLDATTVFPCVTDLQGN